GRLLTLPQQVSCNVHMGHFALDQDPPQSHLDSVFPDGDPSTWGGRTVATARTCHGDAVALAIPDLDGTPPNHQRVLRRGDPDVLEEDSPGHRGVYSNVEAAQNRARTVRRNGYETKVTTDRGAPQTKPLDPHVGHVVNHQPLVG